MSENVMEKPSTHYVHVISKKLLRKVSYRGIISFAGLNERKQSFEEHAQPRVRKQMNQRRHFGLKSTGGPKTE